MSCLENNNLPVYIPYHSLRSYLRAKYFIWCYWVTSANKAILFFKTLSSDMPMVNWSDRLILFFSLLSHCKQSSLNVYTFFLLQGERLLFIFSFLLVLSHFLSKKFDLEEDKDRSTTFVLDIYIRIFFFSYSNLFLWWDNKKVLHMAGRNRRRKLT